MKLWHRCCLLVLSAAGVAGCTPDLGLAPFYCNNGTPACPDGYRCDRGAAPRGICVKEGSALPSPDSSGLDAVTPADDGGITPAPDTGPPPPPTRDIIISEFMANPRAVSDSYGEYIELFNITDRAIDINGWTLADNGSDSHTIDAGGQLIVLPKRYLVIGVSTDPLLNGGVPVAYAVDNFTLGDAADEVLLINSAGHVVDSLAYSSAKGFVIIEGASLSLINPHRDSNDPSNWCVETTPWPGSAGDRGTPGTGPGCL